VTLVVSSNSSDGDSNNGDDGNDGDGSRWYKYYIHRGRGIRNPRSRGSRIRHIQSGNVDYSGYHEVASHQSIC